MRFIVALFALALVFGDQCAADSTIGCSSGSSCTTVNKCPQYTEGYNKDVWKYTCISGKWESITCIQLAPENFKYPTSDIEMLKDQAMTPITPTIECYQCVFKVKETAPNQPAVLPTGINFQPADGTISGTPTVEQEKTEYTIVARAEDAAADAEFKITMMVTTEKANYTLVILIVIVVVILAAIFGTCLFCRLRGTGRARKAHQLKTSQGTKATTNRV